MTLPQTKNKIRIAAALAGVSALVCSASAAVEHVYILNTKGYTPVGLFMFIYAVLIALLIISYHWNDELSGALAIGAGLIAMWTSRSVDYVDGIAVTSGTTTVVHSIFQPDIFTVFALIMFILAILNLYRIWLVEKTPAGVR